MSVPVTVEEKTNKKNDVKARSLLLMALPNEHQLTFIDSIFNRLQKNVSRLAILGVVITQEDLNSKFLRSMPSEWNTHVVVWINKADIEIMSIDDLYNNIKIIKLDVKKSVGASTGAQNMAFMTTPSTSSTNDVNTANPVYEASTVSPNVNTVSPQDLEQIHKDDLEAIDLSANDTAGYDKSKVECFNCHKMGHFARECRAQRNQDGWFSNQDNTRKQGNNEDTSSKAMLAIDGVGFDWSDMAEEQVQTNMALMAFSDSESLDKLIGSQITDNSKKGLRYHAVPPPHPLIYNGPMKLNLSYSGLDEFKEPEFKGYGPRDNMLESNINHDKKSDDSKENSNDSFLKEQISEDTSNFVESPLNSKPQNDNKGFIDSRCLRHITENIDYLSDFKEFDGGYVTFGEGAHGRRISGKATKDETSEILKNFIKEIENLVDKKVKIIRCDNETEFKNKFMDDFCREKGIKREYRLARTPQQNGVVERRNMTLINAARTMLADSKGFKPALSFMRPFGCHVTILNTLDNLGKFDGKVMKDVKDGPHNKDDDKDKSEDDSSPKEVNAAGQHVNTTSLEVNTSCFEFNTVDPSLNTASSSDLHSPTDMFKLGASDTLEATHVEFFSDIDAPEVVLGNIPNSYGVPTTSHTRIHKDYPIKNVIGKVKSSVQTRRMTKPTSKKGFLNSAFLYGTIEEEVYVTQPPGFKDHDHLDIVYKVVKALYGLHQPPRAWYETLANYLLSNGFQRGKIVLFLRLGSTTLACKVIVTLNEFKAAMRETLL
nr:putative ribonuclease H-like domain-containing protein [Tanacetum cinerariifolium]